MKYYKVHYTVVRGKEIVAESIFVYADEKQLPPQQLKDRITKLRMKHYPDQLNTQIMFKIPSPEISVEEYKTLLPGNES